MLMIHSTRKWFATTSAGIEPILKKELEQHSATKCEEIVSGVRFEGAIETGYNICLWSRTANRILLKLGERSASDEKTVYSGMENFPWDEHMVKEDTFSVTASSKDRRFPNEDYCALLVKDGIADFFRKAYGGRPDVDSKKPKIRFHAHFEDEKLELYLDFSGGSLHQRGYRRRFGPASLKEHLAAAVLIESEWPDRAWRDGLLLDPMCGSGTFCIEGALMAANFPPGLLSRRFGFEGWRGHDKKIWKTIVSDAKECTPPVLPAGVEIFGYDKNSGEIDGARQNSRNAGTADLTAFRTLPLQQCPRPGKDSAGLIVLNPPYGRRLEEEELLPPLYQLIGRVLKERFNGWEASVLLPSDEAGKAIGLRAHALKSFHNGEIPCKLARFTVNEENRFHIYLPFYATTKRAATSEQNRSFLANRLKKNQKRLGKYLKRENISCFRLYDADIPEYSSAVDVYADRWVHLQEYAPPKEVPQEKAAGRLIDTIKTVTEVLGIPRERIFVKQRQKQRSGFQYEKVGSASMEIEVEEGGHRFLVNLSDYTDTGLFLDFRNVRRMIGQKSHGKRFLNLFCYTGTATVYAAAGGASETFSVDTNRNYLYWAQRNLELNGLPLEKHRLIRSDCFEWLEHTKEKFDLIFLDPPAFSNSKSREKDFLLQRDHCELISKAADCLRPEGTIVFTAHGKKFTFETEKLEGLVWREIDNMIIPPDFERRSNMFAYYECTKTK